MATLTIRDLPDVLHLRLKERARRNRRSLNQEVIAELAEIDSVTRGQTGDSERAQARAAFMIETVNRLRKPMTRFLKAKELDSAKRKGRA